MEGWTVGLVVVLVVGLAVIIFGALSDRAKNRRAAVEMLAPPQRNIPRFRPDSPAPTYLSDLQARRKPDNAAARDLTSAEREQLAQQLKELSTVRLDLGYASRDFITDSNSARAILQTPRVLVCSERIESTREVLAILEMCSLSGASLVVVAPSMSDEVRGTLEVNALRGTMRLLAVTTRTGSDAELVADATGAQVKSRSDLQSGYVWPEHLGTCQRWVSTAKASFVIGPGQTRGSEP